MTANPSAPGSGDRIDLLEADPRVLEGMLASWGEPRYRADQVRRAVFSRYVSDFERITDLPRALRSRLAAAAGIGSPEIVSETRSEDGLTRKFLFRLGDGRTIETVLMLYADAPDAPELAEGDDPSSRCRRRTVCVSTQVGCPIGCPFCATGLAGFERNLRPGEIVAQVHRIGAMILEDPRLRPARPDAHPVTNVVFMGMGEPFLDFDATWSAVRILTDRRLFAMGARRLTISTAGVVPGIRRMTRENSQVNLAVSLHAPDDGLRDRLVPINRRYPLEVLLRACREYVGRTRRRITFEYALMDGVNDHPRQARAVARLLRGMLCHVNLIALNPTDPDSPFRRPPHARVARFEETLRREGIPTTLRVEKGLEIAAGCGQLRRRDG